MTLKQVLSLVDALAGFLGAIAWPTVVIVLACLFRRDLKALLTRIHQIKATGLEVILRQLEESGHLPFGGRSDLQGLTAHDIWALDTFSKRSPFKLEGMSNAHRVAARTLIDAGLMVLEGEGDTRVVSITPLGTTVLQAASRVL